MRPLTGVIEMRIILLLIICYFPSCVLAFICPDPLDPFSPLCLILPDPVPASAPYSNTEFSLRLNAAALQNVYNLQTFTMINGLTYDCSVFNAKGVCISPGFRYTTSNGTGSDATGVLLIGAYKVNNNIRLGAWVDKNLSANTQAGVNLSSSNPLFGVFGVWSQQADGTGFEARMAAGYGNNDMTVTRTAVDTSEAGVGATGLNSQAVSGMLKYGFSIASNWIASPYVGIRYIVIKTGGYTEAQSAAVTAPLTYDALSHNTTTALAGVRVMDKITPKTTLTASAGFEQDLNNSGNLYNATDSSGSISGLNPIMFNSNIQKTRPAAGVGAYYDVEKNQRIGIDTYYRQEAFQATQSMTVLVTYQAGF